MCTFRASFRVCAPTEFFIMGWHSGKSRVNLSQPSSFPRSMSRSLPLNVSVEHGIPLAHAIFDVLIRWGFSAPQKTQFVDCSIDRSMSTIGTCKKVRIATIPKLYPGFLSSQYCGSSKQVPPYYNVIRHRWVFTCGFTVESVRQRCGRSASHLGCCCWKPFNYSTFINVS